MLSRKRYVALDSYQLRESSSKGTRREEAGSRDAKSSTGFICETKTQRDAETKRVLDSSTRTRTRGPLAVSSDARICVAVTDERSLRSPVSATSDAGDEKGHQVCKGTFDTFRVTLTSLDLIFTRKLANDRHLIERRSILMLPLGFLQSHAAV